MRIQNRLKYIKCSLALVIVSALGLAACGGDQTGDTNSGFSGSSVSGAALGVVGGAVLLGALVAADDDSGSNGTTGGATTGGTTTDGATTGGATAGGTTTDGTTAGGTTAGGTTAGGTTAGGTTAGGTTAGGTTTGGTTTGGTTAGGTTAGGAGGGTAGGTTTGGGAIGGGQGVISDNGSFQADLITAETVPPGNSTGSGNANFIFDVNSGDASGSVNLTGVNAISVDLMVGPTGANGFVAVALEQINSSGTWQLPQNLSDEQKAIVALNIRAGNLYVAARSAAFPNGELRQQILPADITQYRTSPVDGTRGGTAEGFLMLNNTTGDYAITWNTLGGPALDSGSSHVNDGVVSGATENVWSPLTVRASNLAQFFAFGDADDPADSLSPDLLQRLSDGTVWLDSHAVSDGARVFFGQLVEVQ